MRSLNLLIVADSEKRRDMYSPCSHRPIQSLKIQGGPCVKMPIVGVTCDASSGSDDTTIIGDPSASGIIDGEVVDDDELL